MSGLFGKKKTEKPPTPQEAIQKLIDVEDLLKKKSDFLEKKIEEQIEIAKSNASKNKKSFIYYFSNLLKFNSLILSCNKSIEEKKDV
jgi:hypothetical protein